MSGLSLLVAEVLHEVLLIVSRHAHMGSLVGEQERAQDNGVDHERFVIDRQNRVVSRVRVDR